MRGEIPERDWKVFRELHGIWLERYCDRILSEAKEQMEEPGDSKHESYLALYRFLQSRDRELGKAFNDFRRSTAVMQIAIIRKLGVITSEELRRFSEETQRTLQFFWGEAES